MSLTDKIKKNVGVYLPRVQAWALSGFRPEQIETIAGHVASWVGHDPSQALVIFARALAEKATTIPNRFTDDGEQYLLDRLAPLDFRVLFDVGANVGIWSAHALKVFPQADLHAFEIVPETYEELRRQLPTEERIHLNRFGLSDESGRVGVYLYGSNLISSMFALEDRATGTSKIDCEVRRGADYTAANDIAEIDFLKIDVEGAEGKVLKGFEPLVSERRIRLIQFEYNRGSLLGDFLLKHAFAFFTPRGYQLGKLTPDGVYFHSYDFTYEDFAGPNYVACRSDDAALLGLLAAKR